MKTPKNSTPGQEAVAFMRSMLKLLERRGLRYVDPEFAFAMTGMATLIVTPDDPRSEGGSKDAICAAHALLEEFPRTAKGSRLPVSVLRAAVLMAEVGMQELAAANTTEAPQEARS